jgi:glycosyltransferase involved in cell wall biosynthesis
MAAGLPVACTAVGDVPNMVAPENAEMIVPVEDEEALGDALRRLARDPGLRRRLGDANRLKAQSEYDEAAMIRAYADLYAGAIGRPGAFPHPL